MTMQELVAMMNGLILHNPDATIRDYMEVLEEVILIEKSFDR